MLSPWAQPLPRARPCRVPVTALTWPPGPPRSPPTSPAPPHLRACKHLSWGSAGIPSLLCHSLPCCHSGPQPYHHPCASCTTPRSPAGPPVNSGLIYPTVHRHPHSDGPHFTLSKTFFIFLCNTPPHRKLLPPQSPESRTSQSPLMALFSHHTCSLNEPTFRTH